MSLPAIASSPHPLCAARRAKGWTQPVLAERAGVALRTVADIEIRGVAPRHPTQRKILRSLGVEWAQRASVFPTVEV